MGAHPYPMSNPPTVTDSGDSVRITIPSDIAAELDIKPGDQPTEVVFNEEGGEVTFQFG
jgi:bifunctional DNA-binding transcriptional regulator/antitoxin component of YhaV-PrlF toxin-antitoxin module